MTRSQKEIEEKVEQTRNRFMGEEYQEGKQK